MPQWHGYTLWHALFLTIAGWVTHVNWPRLLAAYRWIQGEGGIGMMVVKLTWNPAAKAEPRPGIISEQQTKEKENNNE